MVEETKEYRETSDLGWVPITLHSCIDSNVAPAIANTDKCHGHTKYENPHYCKMLFLAKKCVSNDKVDEPHRKKTCLRGF